jgi:hypothetical protein
MSASPLSEFDKLGPNTLLYTPEDDNFQPDAPMILFFSWMAAAAKHIAKYTATYHKLFPGSRIVLIRANLPDMFRGSAAFEEEQKPAFSIVREHVAMGGEVIVHSFSNGGGTMLVEFMKMWKSNQGTLMPIRAQIMDSSPGRGGWKRSHAAIVMSLPRTILWRWFGSIGVYLFLFGYFLLDRLTGKDNAMVVMCRCLNDQSLFDVKAPRVYLYSRADIMVGDEEVEQHADEAAAKGWKVKKVRFEQSPHAGHIIEDSRKYWDAVLKAWNAGVKV